ncbi:MAG: amidohydrolase family protein [Christensenellales bacterium]
MRKAIDAHVHILPETMLGRTDSALKTKAEKFGIFVYENGETCRRVPPYFENTSFSTEALLATIGQFGIEKAVILQSFTFRINEEVAEAVAKYPDKLKGAMVIDPRDEDSVAQMRFWHKRGLTILKFEMSTVQGFSHPRAYPEMRFDGADVMKLFDEAEKLGITVAVIPARSLVTAIRSMH